MSCDRVVSSASYCGEELAKPVYRRVFSSFFPAPCRIRRPSHPSPLLVGWPKLMPGFFLPDKIHSRGGRAGRAGVGRRQGGGQGVHG